MAEYREFPQPFLDQLANQIIWQIDNFRPNAEDERRILNAMLVNKQWHDTMLRQIGKCTAIHLDYGTKFYDPDTLPGTEMIAYQHGSRGKIQLTKKLFARLIEANYLRANTFVVAWSKRILKESIENSKIMEESPKNWMEIFVRLFSQNFMTIPEQMANSNVFDEFISKFIRPLTSNLNEILPLLLMMNRKSYEFKVEDASSKKKESWLQPLPRFNADRVQCFAIEFQGDILLNFSPINWAEFLTCLLTNCPDLRKIFLHFNLEYAPEWSYETNYMLKFLSKRATEIISVALPSIEIENPAKRPNFYIEIAFTIEIPASYFEETANMFRFQAAAGDPNARYAIFKFTTEEAPLGKWESPKNRLSRLIKTADRHGNEHHFKYTLIGKEEPLRNEFIPELMDYENYDANMRELSDEDSDEN